MKIVKKKERIDPIYLGIFSTHGLVSSTISGWYKTWYEYHDYLNIICNRDLIALQNIFDTRTELRLECDEKTNDSDATSPRRDCLRYRKLPVNRG